MRISLSRTKIGVSAALSAAAVLASVGVASAEPVPPTPPDARAIIESIAEPATPALYNSAQDNLVKGNYDVGFAALDALALAAPQDSNVPALQAFYRNAANDPGGRDAALERLGGLDPELHAAVERAIDIIATSAEAPVEWAPVYDGARTAIVVLGFGLADDGSMRDELIDRLTGAAAAATASPASPVVVTGGNPRNGVAEGDVMRTWLIDNGVAAERIYVENRANSTPQNAVLTQPLLRDIGAQSVVLATSANHVRRSISDFAIAGSNVIGAVSPDPESIPEVPALGLDSRLGLTVDATKVVGIPRVYE
ncbi:YdcF family protein [Rhodococcus sp. Eu-32]|uniref:YdcF family protein n=1 Tax=Rhodococcus sp. Eu-32 TaxID=1017319 RepID=UPI000F795744|nr:YdcF family protein [Rhodococcus sp. Eu-32]RRQ27536.1 YdcF family protein [Rhodococcus sp. Eu-32]